MQKLGSILLVEDDNITNFINKRLISKLEVAEDIRVATNGAEAISFIRKRLSSNDSCPELIFLDINMPVMDGFEFLQEFKRLQFEQKENVVIVVLTTSTNQNDIEKLKNSGNTDFINKPLTKEKIQTIVEKNFSHISIKANIS